jgi:hypothetical protein
MRAAAVLIVAILLVGSGFQLRERKLGRPAADPGIRTVILHMDMAPGTESADAAIGPVQGLPQTREDRGDVLLDHLGPISG